MLELYNAAANIESHKELLLFLLLQLKVYLARNNVRRKRVPTHLTLVKVVHVNLTVCVSCSDPFAILTGTQQMHWLSGS